VLAASDPRQGGRAQEAEESEEKSDAAELSKDAHGARV
jgi:hypothetical protein